MAVTLGKDVTVTGLTGARSITINNAANEVECTSFADGSAGFRKYKKTLIEQTIEVECVEDPGVSVGASFTLDHTNLKTADTIEFLVTNVARSEPLDGIKTFTVSATRYKTQS
jgi:hypothetical protein